MNKLTKQSPLFDITNRINEIIDELNNNREIYLNFKPDIKDDIKKIYTDKDLPAAYEALIMGLYKIVLNSERANVKLEIFRNGKTELTSLNIQKKEIKNIFLSKGDKILIKENNLSSTDSIVISLEMNILDAFIDQYEAVKTNIDIVTNISNESNKKFEELKETISSFYMSINFEPVSQIELKSLIDSIEA